MKAYTKLTISILLFCHINAAAVNITPATNKIPNAPTASAPQATVQQVETPNIGFNPSVPFAAQHMPTCAGENVPTIESNGLPRYNIKVNAGKATNYLYTPQYNAQELWQTSHKQTWTTMGSSVGGNTSTTLTTSAQSSSLSESVTVVAIPQTTSFIDRWRNQQVAAEEEEESPTLARRKIIIDGGDPDDGDETNDPDFDSPVGEMPLGLLLFCAIAYIAIRQTNTAKQKHS